MVLVFKTNVRDNAQAEVLCEELEQRFPRALINMDLEDCDKILRVDNAIGKGSEIMAFMHHKGFLCEELE